MGTPPPFSSANPAPRVGSTPAMTTLFVYPKPGSSCLHYSCLAQVQSPPRTKLGTHTPCLQLSKAPASILPWRSLWWCGYNAVSPATAAAVTAPSPPDPAGEAQWPDANGEVRKNPPMLFAPWQAGAPLKDRHRSWKGKHAKGDTPKLRARDGGTLVLVPPRN